MPSQIQIWGSVFSFLVLSNLSTYLFAQNSKLENIRTWKDESGKFSIEAELLAANREKVRLRRISDDSKVTIAFDKLSGPDRKYILEYCDRSLDELKSKSREVVFASEALDLFERFLAKGFVDDVNRVYIETRIAELKEQTQRQAIFINDRFLHPDELLPHKQQFKQGILDWIDQSKADDVAPLRQVFKEDPTSLDAIILVALSLDISLANFPAVERALDMAIKSGKRYKPVAMDADEMNLIIAINNYAVFNARRNRVSKALRLWTEILEGSNQTVPIEVLQNLAKTCYMAENEKNGVIADPITLKKLNTLSGQQEPVNHSGGWRLLIPLDLTGNPYSNLEFLISDPQRQRILGNFIEDTRCVRCEGRGAIPCPNKECKNGKIVEYLVRRTTVPMPGGAIKIVEVPAGVRYHTCPQCKGGNRVTCPCCRNGIQR